MAETMEQALEKAENAQPAPLPVVAGFQDGNGFDLMLRQAKWLASSDLLPQQFKGNIPNTIIALEISNRMSASPLAVMQNLYIVHGKPGWSAQFIIAAVNSTGKFSPLRFQIENGTCTAWAIEKATGERLESPPVSLDMAKKEGWFDKAGSKWKTMPELMLRYRAATFFGRLYAPEVLMGMKTIEEIEDIIDLDPIPQGSSDIQEKTETKKEALKSKLKGKKEQAQTIPDATPLDEPEPTDETTVECPDNPGDSPLKSWCVERCMKATECSALKE